jgi:transposase
LKALIINILFGKQPLYHIHHFFQKQDVEMLFGSGVKTKDLNEYCLGRALDVLYKATPWKVYSTLVISAGQKLGLSLGTLHNDTTSFSLYGEYNPTEENPEGTDDDLQITYGNSKQHRPDLKQIVLSISVTPDRIPILATVENGNKNDKG